MSKPFTIDTIHGIGTFVRGLNSYVHSENNTPHSFAVHAVAGEVFESRFIPLLAPFRVAMNQGKRVC